jgi:hypothetical protein
MPPYSADALHYSGLLPHDLDIACWDQKSCLLLLNYCASVLHKAIAVRDLKTAIENFQTRNLLGSQLLQLDETEWRILIPCDELRNLVRSNVLFFRIKSAFRFVINELMQAIYEGFLFTPLGELATAGPCINRKTEYFISSFQYMAISANCFDRVTCYFC